MYQPRPFSSLFTLFSHPTSLLPSFFLEASNRATSLLRCNSLFIVIKFLVFLSILCSSFLFHLRIPPLYLIIETAQMISATILFLPFSLLFKINFALLNYSFLNLSFISCSFVLSYFNITSYLYPSSILLSFYYLVILSRLLTYLSSIHNNHTTF